MEPQHTPPIQQQAPATSRTSELELQLAEMQGTIDEIHHDIKRMRLYQTITFWGGILLFVVPLLALPFVIGTFFSSYLNSLSLPSSGAPSAQQSSSASTQQLNSLLNSLGY